MILNEWVVWIWTLKCRSALKFGCHIDATEQQRALNFQLVVSDQLFSLIIVAYNKFKIQRPLLLSGINAISKWTDFSLIMKNQSYVLLTNWSKESFCEMILQRISNATRNSFGPVVFPWCNNPLIFLGA